MVLIVPSNKILSCRSSLICYRNLFTLYLLEGKTKSWLACSLSAASKGQLLMFFADFSNKRLPVLEALCIFFSKRNNKIIITVNFLYIFRVACLKSFVLSVLVKRCDYPTLFCEINFFLCYKVPFQIYMIHQWLFFTLYWPCTHLGQF